LMLEDARISANRETSVIRVIDPPFVPEKRAWPKRKQIVIVSTLAALFWTCFFLALRENWRKGMFGAEPSLPVNFDAYAGSGLGNRIEESDEGETR
ncbi:MAG: hypothetical protein KAX38_01130, partial [Candidatus Krumholzibacteria bacterium]|nr:hypothetical protein [Candidatus Krumholzibacteria bacterium]